MDRPERCPTCGSSDAPRVCCPGTHAPDDHDATCEPCWYRWHSAPPPAPRDEAHGEVVLWRYGTELFDTRRPPPEVEHYEYIAVPAAQRERERALIEEGAFRGYEIERAAFDAWWIDNWKSGTTCAAWDAWYARAKLAALRGKGE